jgi:8-oxo-dGTP diphosphatase
MRSPPSRRADTDTEELDAVAWVKSSEITDYVPYPFWGPVQEHLDVALIA